MKKTVHIPRPSASSVEPELLVKFITKTCQGAVECSDVVVSLALAAISQDRDFHERLKELISSSDSREEILRMSERILFPALFGFPAPFPEVSDETEGYKAPDDKISQIVLSYALREGRDMLASGNHEFIKVFEILTRAGLGCYPYRLYLFMDTCQRFNDDPETLVREGIAIIDSVTTSTSNQN